MLGTATPHRGARCLPFTGGSALTSLPINQMLEGRSAPRGPSAPRKDRGHRVISSPRMSPPAPGNRGLRHRAQNGAAESPLWWVSRWPVACETRVCVYVRMRACARVCACACVRVRLRGCACVCARALPGRGASGSVLKDGVFPSPAAPGHPPMQTGGRPGAPVPAQRCLCGRHPAPRSGAPTRGSPPGAARAP